MSKRCREGPTLVANKRFCDQTLVTSGFKRERDDYIAIDSKRQRLEASGGKKRSADFDQGQNNIDFRVDHVEKGESSAECWVSTSASG